MAVSYGFVFAGQCMKHYEKKRLLTASSEHILVVVLLLAQSVSAGAESRLERWLWQMYAAALVVSFVCQQRVHGVIVSANNLLGVVMTKNLLSWMAAGLAAIVVATVNYVAVHPGLSLKAVALYVATALIVRAANWVIANYGPSES